MEKRIVSGVAYSRDEAKISLFGLPDHPGVSSSIFGALADANVNVDMIVQSHARTADTANMEFTVGKRDAGRAVEIVRGVNAEGIAVIWIEHVVRALLSTVDRLLCLANGEVVADGEPRQVLASEAVRRVYLGGAIINEATAT